MSCQWACAFGFVPCFTVTEPAKSMPCWLSMHLSVLLLLLLLHHQCCCLLVGVGCWCCLQFIHLPHFLAHISDPVIGVLCLSSMPRSVLLLLQPQSCSLLVCVDCWQCLQLIHFAHILLAHIPDPVIGVLCLSSMHRSVLLLLLLQCRYLLVGICC